MPGHPLIESLEPRLLLSGNVAVSVVGISLFITGDDLSNDIVVTRTGQTGYQIASGSSATTVNNVAGPLTFDGVTGDVNATLNGGDDRIEFGSSGLMLGSLNIWTGSGTNTVYIHGGFTIAGNLAVYGGANEDDVLLAGAVVHGGITVLAGTGASDVEMGATTVTGGVTVFASGGGTLTGSWAGYSTALVINNGSSVDGAVNVFNGPGPNTVGLNNATTGSVFISNGSGAAYAGLANTTVNGSFTFLRGDGGALVAPLAAYAGQVNMDHTHLTGGVTVVNGSGTDLVGFDTCTVGAGVFINNGAGPSSVGASATTFAGGFTVMDTGGGSLPSNPDWSTLTAFLSNCEIGGDLNCFMGAGADSYGFGSLTAHGNVLISSGPGAAAGGGSGSAFQKSFTFLRGDGGTIGSTSDFASDMEFSTSTFGAVTIINGSGNNCSAFSDGALSSLFVSSGMGASVLFLSNAPVAGNVTHFALGGGHTTLPQYADYSTYTSISNTGATGHVAGDVTVFGGAGNDFVNVTKVNVDGRVFLVAGPDGVLLVTSGEIIKGGITVLRGEGGNLAAQNGYASYVSMTNTVELSGMTFINGSGTDGLYMTNVGGVGLLVLDGPGGAAISASNLVLSGSLTVIRGDGGTIPAVPGYASYEQYTAGTEVHGAFIMNGAGKDLVSLDSANFGGYTTIMNGAGDQVVGVTSSATPTDTGPLFISGAGGVAQISIGDVSGVYTDIGSLTITTGDSNDVITFRRFAVFGAVSVNTGGGDDTVTIDDGTVLGEVSITTGPAYVASGTDNDTVNIERVAGTTDNVQLAAMLRVNLGAGDDHIRIGLHGDAQANVQFHLGFNLDGGPGANTLDYWTGGNVFDAGAVQPYSNFAVVM